MVAVVDEGLLSLTNFKTPDPSDHSFQRCCQNTAETVGWGISSPSMDSASAGGGADEGTVAAKRSSNRSLFGLDWWMLPRVVKRQALSIPTVQWFCACHGLDRLSNSFASADEMYWYEIR